MNTGIVVALMARPYFFFLQFIVEPLAASAVAYGLVWLVMRPKDGRQVSNPLLWHAGGLVATVSGGAIFRIIAMVTFAGRGAYEAVAESGAAGFYMLIVPAVVSAGYIAWLKSQLSIRPQPVEERPRELLQPQAISQKNLVVPPLAVASVSQADMFEQAGPVIAGSTSPSAPSKLAPAVVSAAPVGLGVLTKFGPWIFGAICLTALLLNISLKKETRTDTQAAAAIAAAEPVLQPPVGNSVAGVDSTHKTAHEMWQQEVNRVYQAEVDALMTAAKAEGLDYKGNATLSKEFNRLVRDFDAEATAQGMTDDGLKASKWALKQAHDVMRMRHADQLVNAAADMKDSTTTAISAAILGLSPPVPTFSDNDKRLAYLRWLGRMSTKLQKKMPDAQLRKEFLQTVWYESKRAGFDATLVLGVIATLSDFRKPYVSDNGARGYMAVNPAWSSKIGDGDTKKLFHMQTNLRFGCVVLRHYLDLRQGDLYEGLMDYVADNLGINRDDQRAVQLATRVMRNSVSWK